MGEVQKPVRPGSHHGDKKFHGGAMWEWVQYPIVLFDVIAITTWHDQTHQAIVAVDLERRDAATLAGLLLLSPPCLQVQLFPKRQGDWIQVVEPEE